MKLIKLLLIIAMILRLLLTIGCLQLALLSTPTLEVPSSGCLNIWQQPFHRALYVYCMHFYMHMHYALSMCYGNATHFTFTLLF